MTINSVTSNSDLYEAMVQQAAALRAAQEPRVLAAGTARAQTGQAPPVQSSAAQAPSSETFELSLSAQTRLADQRERAEQTPVRASDHRLQKRVAGSYRSPWADANSLVVQTRSPGGMTVPDGVETTVAAAAKPAADAPKPTFVDVQSIYVDAADEESARSSRNPFLQFAAHLYQNVVATSRRSATTDFVGSSFSAVA